MADVHEEWDALMGVPTTFIIDLKTHNIVRNLTFKFLIDSLNASGEAEMTFSNLHRALFGIRRLFACFSSDKDLTEPLWALFIKS